MCRTFWANESRVIVTRGEYGPRCQLFLAFSDGTYYEFYCYDRDISGTSETREGDLPSIRKSIADQEIIAEAYDESIRD